MEELIAPDPKVNFKKVNIEDLYSMKIPDFMTVTTQLQEDASLQYSNPFKGKYVTVLDEKREDVKQFMNDFGLYDNAKSMLENYVDTRLSYLKESGISIFEETELESVMINGRKAYSVQINGTIPEVPDDIAYFFTYIEGKDHFYMITSWTLLARKSAYIDEVDEMVNSFKEL